MSRFLFSSEISSDFKEQLASLLFFNIEQRNVAEGIIASIEKYGLPHIEDDSNKLKVSVEKVQEIQSIFAYDESAGSKDLVGVMLFFRETEDCVTLLHIAVKENYTFRTSQGESLLAVELLFKLKDIARHLKKVEYLSIYYQKYVAKRMRIVR